MSDKKCPIDVVLDTNGCWRVLYSDGSLGPALSIDEMLRCSAAAGGSSSERLVANAAIERTDRSSMA